MKKKTEDIGVIVGRFQVHQLHQGHKELLNYVIDRHKKVLVFLGVAPAQPTKRNPLDFITRKLMLLQEYSELTVLPISDTRSDDVWSKQLDDSIRQVCPIGTVKLYGGRDSFVVHYHGSFKAEEFEPTVFESGTQMREEIAQDVGHEAAFRAGVVYATYNRFPITYPTVDVCVYRTTPEKGAEILLIRKKDESGWRLIGGFVDPTDVALESACHREVNEEAGVGITDPVYIGSGQVQDFRYQGETDGIMTSLFMAKYQFGAVQPADDAAEAKWWSVDFLTGVESKDVIEEHRVLVTQAMNWLQRKGIYEPKGD